VFCPKCGTESSTGLNFCRRCGLNLQRVTTALSAEFSADELEPGADEARRRALRRAFTLLPWGVLLLFSGIIIEVIGDEMLHEKLMESAGVVLILLGVMLSALAFLNPALLVKPAARLRERELPESPQAALPEERFAREMPSVAEVTTRDLADRERR
jgi:hypothetical protein